MSKAYGIAVIGVGIQLFAGAFDQWWHATFGVDKALSPPHLTLIMGITVSLAAIFTGLTHSLNLAVNKSLARVIELSRVISWVCLWSVLVALLIIFVLPDPFTSLPTGTQLVILEAGFVFIALSMIFSGMKLIQLRWSATLLLGMRTLLVLYPTLIFADPKLHGLAPWFFLIITPAIPIDIARHKLMEQPSYLVVTGAALGSLFNLAFYPMNYAIYGGAVPPITLETNLLMAAVGLLGSAVGLGGVQWFHLLVPRIEPHSAQP